MNKKIILYVVLAVIAVIALSLIGYGAYAALGALVGGGGVVLKKYQKAESDERERNAKNARDFVARNKRIAKDIAEKQREKDKRINEVVPSNPKEMKKSILKDAKDIGKWSSILLLLFIPSTALAQNSYTKKEELAIKTALKKCKILKVDHELTKLKHKQAVLVLNKDHADTRSKLITCQDKKEALVGQKCFCVVPWIITISTVVVSIGAGILIWKVSR